MVALLALGLAWLVGLGVVLAILIAHGRRSA